MVQFGPFTAYHSGDCIPYDGQVELLRKWSFDLALLPINGRAPERRVAGNFWGREAAELAKEIGARIVVPCHYDMFTFNTATPDEFVAACERRGVVPVVGEMLELDVEPMQRLPGRAERKKRARAEGRPVLLCIQDMDRDRTTDQQ